MPLEQDLLERVRSYVRDGESGSPQFQEDKRAKEAAPFPLINGEVYAWRLYTYLRFYYTRLARDQDGNISELNKETLIKRGLNDRSPFEHSLYFFLNQWAMARQTHDETKVEEAIKRLGTWANYQLPR